MEASKYLLLFLFGATAAAEVCKGLDESALLQTRSDDPTENPLVSQDKPEPALDIESANGMLKYQDEWFKSDEDECRWQQGYCGEDYYLDIEKSTLEGCRRACQENYHCQGLTYSKDYKKSKACRLILDQVRSKPCLECVRAKDACAGEYGFLLSGKECFASQKGECDWHAINKDNKFFINKLPDACDHFSEGTQVFKWTNDLKYKVKVHVDTCTEADKGKGFATQLAVFTSEKWQCVHLDCNISITDCHLNGNKLGGRSEITFVAKPGQMYYVAHRPKKFGKLFTTRLPVRVVQEHEPFDPEYHRAATYGGHGGPDYYNNPVDKYSYKGQGYYYNQPHTSPKYEHGYNGPHFHKHGDKQDKKKDSSTCKKRARVLSGEECTAKHLLKGEDCQWHASNDISDVQAGLFDNKLPDACSNQPSVFSKGSQLFLFKNDVPYKVKVHVTTCTELVGFFTQLAVYETDDWECVPLDCNISILPPQKCLIKKDTKCYHDMDGHHDDLFREKLFVDGKGKNMDADDMDAVDVEAEGVDAEDVDAEDVDAEDVDAEDVDAEDVDADAVDGDIEPTKTVPRKFPKKKPHTLCSKEIKVPGRSEISFEAKPWQKYYIAQRPEDPRFCARTKKECLKINLKPSFKFLCKVCKEITKLPIEVTVEKVKHGYGYD